MIVFMFELDNLVDPKLMFDDYLYIINFNHFSESFEI